MSQVFERDNRKIYWGDAIEVLSKDIEDASIDLLFADPLHRLIVLDEAQMKFPGKREFIDPNGLAEHSFHILALASFPDRHHTGVLGRRNTGDIILRHEDPGKRVAARVGEVLAEGSNVLLRRASAGWLGERRAANESGE